MAQFRADSGEELALVTAGDDLTHIARFLPPGQDSYTAADVLQRILSETDGTPTPAPGG